MVERSVRRRVENPEEEQQDVDEKDGGEQDRPERGHDEARVPRMLHDPGRPTRKEREEHWILHYPFRSWCKHCLRGKGVSGPHRCRSADDKEFSKGRVPTISIDHCFLGSEAEEEHAASNPFLIVHDADSGAMYCIAMRT